MSSEKIQIGRVLQEFLAQTDAPSTQSLEKMLQALKELAEEKSLTSSDWDSYHRAREQMNRHNATCAPENIIMG